MLEPSQELDPAALAASIRELAYDARRILNDPTRSPFELRGLSLKIGQLQGQLAEERGGELNRWLDSLSRKVQADPTIEARRSACCDATATLVRG
jgi:hypothetical protein